MANAQAIETRNAEATATAERAIDQVVEEIGPALLAEGVPQDKIRLHCAVSVAAAAMQSAMEIRLVAIDLMEQIEWEWGNCTSDPVKLNAMVQDEIEVQRKV